MSQNKFEYIRASFCLYDPWIKKEIKNPITKIEYMIDHLVTRSRALYTPEAELCIDESMIKYKGKSSMTVFVKNKPI